MLFLCALLTNVFLKKRLSNLRRSKKSRAALVLIQHFYNSVNCFKDVNKILFANGLKGKNKYWNLHPNIIKAILWMK